jgi:hypothetical protein
LSYDYENKWDIKLTWRTKWRSIELDKFFNSEILITQNVGIGSPNSYKRWLQWYIERNNVVEELFRFTQTLRWIPESEWKIKNDIDKLSPIWNNEDRPTIKE